MNTFYYKRGIFVYIFSFLIALTLIGISLYVSLPSYASEQTSYVVPHEWSATTGDGEVFPACASASTNNTCSGTSPLVTITYGPDLHKVCDAIDFGLQGPGFQWLVPQSVNLADCSFTMTLSGLPTNTSYSWEATDVGLPGTGFTGGSFTTLNCAPLDAVCGTNSQVFAYTESEWPLGGNFCGGLGDGGRLEGFPTLPAFPAQGGSTSWTCLGQQGGSNISCSASRLSSVSPICGGGVDMGFRLYENGVRKVAVEPGSPTSNFRLYKDGTRGVVLVDPSDPNASKLRIQTPAGVKALCLLP